MKEGVPFRILVGWNLIHDFRVVDMEWDPAFLHAANCPLRDVSGLVLALIHRDLTNRNDMCDDPWKVGVRDTIILQVLVGCKNLLIVNFTLHRYLHLNLDKNELI